MPYTKITRRHGGPRGNYNKEHESFFENEKRLKRMGEAVWGRREIREWE